MAPKWISRDTPLLPILLPHLTGAELPVPRSTVTAPHKSGHLFIFGSGVGGELGLGPGIHERRKPGQLKSFAVPLDHTNQLYAAAKEIPEVVAIECGGQHSLALDSQGRVWSWGINDQGALGRHTVEEILSGSDSDSDCSDKGPLITGKDAWWPGIVDIRNEQNNPVKVVQMVCADSFSAVLTSDGEVYAWGSFRDPSGVIGFSKQMERQSQPLPKRMYFGNEKVVLLGSGENHIFAVTDDETIWAFGANDENQLGRRVSSRFKNNLEPYEIKATGRRNQSLHNIIKITGGAYHTLYINSLGHLYALGCNNCGQLGLGDTNPHINGPERIEWAIAGDGKTRIPMPQVVDIAAGESHSIAVSADGRVFSWGANLEGQLGYTADRPIYGDYRDGLPITVKHGRKTPSPPTSVRSSPAKQRQASQPSPHAQSEASDADRESYKLKYQPMPRQINADCFQDDEGTEDYIVQVDAQSRFSIAVSAFGNLYTWGSGHCYQLGNEEMEDCPTPYCVQLKTRKCFWARCGGQFTAFLLEPKREEMKEPAMMTSTARGGGAGGRGRQRNGGSPKRSLQQFQNNSNGNNANGSTADNNYPQFDGMDTSYSYRMKLAPPTSLPTSPVRIPVAQTSPMRQSPGVPLKDATQALLSTFESVCVSPEKKRVRMEHDPMSSPSRQFTREEKMAPWSPTKRNSPALFNSPMQEDADENGEVLPVKKQPAVKKAVRSSIAQRLNALSAQQQQQQQQSQQQPQQQHPHQSGATTRSLRNRKPI